MNNTTDPTAKPPKARGGWLMMLLGWALAFWTVTFFYHQVLGKSSVLKAEQPPLVSEMSLQPGQITVDRNSADQYILPGTINGEEVLLLIDTGATDIAIPMKMAQRLRSPNLGQVELMTAAGATTGYKTKISELRVGNFLFKDISAVAIPKLSETGENFVLLGMNALRRLEIIQRDGQLVLRVP